MAHAKVSTQAVADALGVSYQAIRRAEEGKTKALSAANNEKAAAFLNVSSRWLATGKGLMVDAIADAANAEAVEVGGLPRATKIPVAGYAKLGENGWYDEVLTLGAAGYVEAHSSDPDAYALRVKGDSMFPAIRDGWYVVVEPNGAPAAGEYVAIAMKDGRKMVKEFLFRGASGVSVQSVNGGARLTISDDETLTIHAIGAVLMPSKHREI